MRFNNQIHPTDGFTHLLHHKQDVTQGQFVKWSATALNSEFSFSYTGCLNNFICPYYLPIACERREIILPFPKALAQREI